MHSQEIPKDVQENCFSVLKTIGKVLSPTEKHSDSYRNSNTQETLDKQVYRREGNQMHKGICHVLEEDISI